MLKFFYRLRRRRGVVLFTVIAIMTLLIAMATTAYFTARASYKTVVSNYDFSQLYLSTTSMSDMIIGALTQTTSRSDVVGSDGKKLNDYSGLKQAVLDLKTTGTVGSSITGYSHNMYASKSGSENDLLMAAAADPVEAGVIDGVKVTITLEKTWPQLAADSTPTGKNYYSFSITTTGFYRNNMVSVQDTVYNLAGTTSIPSKSPSFDTFFKNTGGSKKDTKGERAVIIATEEISDNAYFENTYTIFTELSGGNNIFKGGITATGSVFFKGQVETDIPAPGMVWNKDGSETSMANARHDWFINGDFGLISDNIHKHGSKTGFDLNGNNLYVNGNLILGAQEALKAHNIYVTGNIYIMNSGASIELQNQGGVDGALYCGGNIYFTKDMTDKGGTTTSAPLWNDDGTTNSGFVSKYGGGWATIQDEYDAIVTKTSLAAAEVGGSDGGKSWAVDNNANNKEFFTGKTVYLGNGTTGGEYNSTYFSSLKDKGDYDPASTSVTYSTLKADGNTYVYESHTGTVKDLFDYDSGVTKPNDWTAYTAKDETMENKLTIDVSIFSGVGNSNDGWDFPKDKTGKVTGPAKEEIKDASDKVIAWAEKEYDGDATYYFYSAKDAKHTNPTTVTWVKDDNAVTVDIKFDKRGYFLDLVDPHTFVDWSNNGNNNLTYNIHTDDSIETGTTGYKGTMPIVLAANFDDGTPTTKDTNDNNAFSWTGGTEMTKTTTKVRDWSIWWDEVYNDVTTYSGGANGATNITYVNIVNVDGTASAGKVSSDGKASAGGNVIFEMGNLDSSGNYVAYDKSKSGLDAVTYHAGERDLVGTLAQTTEIAKGGKDGYTKAASQGGAIKNLYKDSGNGSDVKPAYENRVMLISNKVTNGVGSGRLAYRSDADSELFCGYIYAPDGLYGNGYGNQKVPVFGGLIVSEMVAAMSSYEYAEPDPTIVAQMLEGLTPKGGSTTTGGSTDGIWYIDNVNYGKNYLG